MNKLTYIFDGAFGTYYQQKTSDFEPCELANNTNPKVVAEIHTEYIKAGATAIKTNTFALNSNTVEDIQFRNQLIKQAVHNAKEAISKNEVVLFADIGYIQNGEASEYLAIVKEFAYHGVTHFLFETMLEYECIKDSVDYLHKEVKDVVIIASFACNEDGYTSLGNYYKNLFDQAKDDCDIVGLNCMSGPSRIYQLLSDINFEQYALSAMPNVGYPSIVNHRAQYHDNAEYYSDMLIKLCSLGVCAIGGCCGSTPLHIEQTVKKIRKTKMVYERYIVQEAEVSNKKSHSMLDIMKKRKLLAIEIQPPSTMDVAYFLKFATTYKQEGADVITIVDSPHARPCADALMMASKIKREVNIDVIPHLTCRDKNSIAMKGSLIAANMDNIDNVLVLTGDPISKGDRLEHQPVFSFNSYNLINYINQLNEDVFKDKPFCLGGALNVNAENFDAELERAQKKVDNKVDYFITQSIFEERAIANVKKAKEVLSVPIVVGFYPVVSYRNAIFLNNEISGIQIPSDFIATLETATKEEYKEISLSYMKQLIKKIFNHCDGFYITTPLKKVDFVCELMNYIKELDSHGA